MKISRSNELQYLYKGHDVLGEIKIARIRRTGHLKGMSEKRTYKTYSIADQAEEGRKKDQGKMTGCYQGIIGVCEWRPVAEGGREWGCFTREVRPLMGCNV